MGAHAEQLRAAHLDLMLFGWLVQFVLAVGYWMLPRHAEGPDRGPKWLAWSAGGAFQAGLVLAVAAAFTPGAATLAARVLLAAGALLLAGLLYPRVRPFTGE
jgi:heme/copper-type cytochrome/quinol oxidase subunit 1